jgi:hypothetical protein
MIKTRKLKKIPAYAFWVQVHVFPIYRISRDFQQLASVLVNCSAAKKLPKKVLTFDTTDSAEISDIYSKFFFVIVQSNLDFHDYSALRTARIGHMHQVMRPIIYEADESLADLSPAQ